MITVSLVSLGCAKNLVDSEIMVGHLLAAGMRVVPDAANADAVIVNTCSFIGDAKEESIQAILEIDERRRWRKRRREQKLIVAGCLAQRFAKELTAEMPEVDAFIGLDQVTKVAEIVERLCARSRAEGELPITDVNSRSTYIPDYDTPRFRLTPKHTAYIKIAEGCNHTCTFCAIPQIRGRHRSRTIDSVVHEARRLVADGVKELNLISQDTTYFGMDRWSEKAGPRARIDSARGDTIAALLRELDGIEGDFWIRLLYTHPAHWSEELVRTIAASRKIARYVDIPLQHISDHMLGEMQRETSSQHIRNLVRTIRAGIPGVTMRTTFIVGFPGETEADFAELLEFVRETRFERLGVFRYSPEEGTRAAKRAGQVSSRIKDKRWHAAMSLQQGIVREIGGSRVGSTLRVLVESPGIARAEGDAPDIDGRVYVSKTLPVGEFASVTVRGVRGYDLLALPRGEHPARAVAPGRAS